MEPVPSGEKVKIVSDGMPCSWVDLRVIVNTTDAAVSRKLHYNLVGLEGTVVGGAEVGEVKLVSDGMLCSWVDLRVTANTTNSAVSRKLHYVAVSCGYDTCFCGQGLLWVMPPNKNHGSG